MKSSLISSPFLSSSQWGVSVQFDATPTTPLPAIATRGIATPASLANMPTVADFYRVWTQQMRPQWSRLHAQGVSDIFAKHVLPRWGNRRLDQLTRADVLSLRAHLAQLPGVGGRTLSGARINKVMALLQQFLAEAGEQLAIANPARGIKRIKVRRADINPFSLNEVDLLCNQVRADYRAYLQVRFLTGMRTGEVNGLKWRYVDFDRNLILVRETFSAGEVEEKAKTEHSIRDIPMLPPVKKILLAHRSLASSDHEYVFSSSRGNPIDAHNFANRIWYPLLDRVGLDRRRPYQTRHTTATVFLAAGENPEWIARLMGHASTQMLFTTYSRYVPNLTRRDGSAVCALLASGEAE